MDKMRPISRNAEDLVEKMKYAEPHMLLARHIFNSTGSGSRNIASRSAIAEEGDYYMLVFTILYCGLNHCLDVFRLGFIRYSYLTSIQYEASAWFEVF